MKLPTWSTLLATALLSAVVVIPFLPAAYQKADRPDYFVEVKLASTTPGSVEFFFDDGLGFRANMSAREILPTGVATKVVRLQVPEGAYRRFRFDPVDTTATVTVDYVRIVDSQGRVVRDLPLTDFQSLNEIHTLQFKNDRLVITTQPQVSDPQLLFAFSPPLNLSTPWGKYTRGWILRASCTFLVLLIVLVALQQFPAWPSVGRNVYAWIKRHPHSAILLVAFAAVIVSSYPVVFLGRSLVSPNLGSVLLYDRFPTLPGYTSSHTADVKGADIGAVMWQHLPFSRLERNALLQGELPLWNRYNSTGVPLLGQGQSMFGDPLNLAVALVGGSAWAWDIKYLAAKWLFAVGIGLSVYTLTGRLSASMITAASSAFIGFFLYRVNHPAIFSLCYSPWIVFCWLRVSQSRQWAATARWTAGLALANWMVLNSGTVKEAYMLLLSLNLTGLLVLLGGTTGWRERLTKLALLTWVGVTFCLISAPIWLTFLNALSKAYTSYDSGSAYQIQPSLLLGAFDELFYRPLTSGERVFNPSANFFILLGVLYFVATIRTQGRNRKAMALAISTLVPLSLAFGLASPRWVATIPLLRNVAHLDNTFTCCLIVLWAIMAGVGFSTAAERLAKPEGRGDLVAVGLLLFAMVFAYVGYGHAAHRSVFEPGSTFSGLAPGQILPVSTFVWNSLLVSLGAALLLAWTLRRSLTIRRLSPAAGLLLITCALIFHWHEALQAQSVGFTDYTLQPTLRVDLDAPSPAVQFIRRSVAQIPGRSIGLGDNLFPGWTNVYGLEGICGPDALANPEYRELCDIAPIKRLNDWRMALEEESFAKARPFLDFLNVRYYCSTPGDTSLAQAGLRLVDSADLDVYESPTAWPRAFFTDRLIRYDKVDDLMWLISSEKTPFAAILRRDSPRTSVLESVSSAHTPRKIVAASNYNLTGNSTAFDIEAPSSGVVVLTEAWSPGDFSARLNGQIVPVLKLNHAFKGVYLPAAGHYHVIFRYWPEHLTLSLWLCAFGAILTGLTFFIVPKLPASLIQS